MKRSAVLPESIRLDRIPLWGFAAGILLVALGSLVLWLGTRNQVDISLTLQAESPSRLQVFHDDDGHYAERKSHWFNAGESGATHGFSVGGQDARHVRLDPVSRGTVSVCDLRIEGDSADYEIVYIEQASIERSRGCLHITPSLRAVDPKVVLRFTGAAFKSIKQAGRANRIRNAALAFFFLALVASFFGMRRSARVGFLSMLAATPPGFVWLDRRAAWVCFALMMAFGAVYIVVTPPGAVADEAAHMAKIVQVGEGRAFGSGDDQLMPSTHVMYGAFSDYLINKQPFSYGQLERQLRLPLACEPTSDRLPQQAAGYFPHQYMVPAVVFRLSCATGSTFGTFLYLSRLLNLVLAAALVAWGLSKAVRGKWALFLVALLPMSLFQMASVSADSLTIGVSLAWLGLISGVAGRKVSPDKAGLALWFLSLTVAFLKPGTAWVLVCFVFCKPVYDEAGRPFYSALARHVVLPWVIHMGWTLLASENASALRGVEPVANLALLANEPLTFLRLFVNAFTGFRGLALLDQMVGVLGWLDVRLSDWSYQAGVLALLGAFWANGIPRASCSVFAVAWAAVFGSLLLLALPLFLFWTPTGADAVQGLQGRYFTATAAFALTWGSFRSPAGVQALLVAGIVLVVVAINADAVWRLHEAYFVTGRF